MRIFLSLLFALALTHPACATGPNVLTLKRTQAEAEAVPEVAALKEKIGSANIASRELSAKRSHINDQTMAMYDKWRQNNNGSVARTPEEQMELIKKSKQRFDNLESQMLASNAQKKKIATDYYDAKRAFLLARAAAQIDDPSIRVFTMEGHSWDDTSEDLEMRLNLRDQTGKTFLLITPQRIDQLPQNLCAYWEKQGEIWAIKDAELVSNPSEVPAVIKVASLNQIFFLDRAMQPSCPFGKVVQKVEKKK